MKITTVSTDKKNTVEMEITLRNCYTVKTSKELMKRLQVSISLVKSGQERETLQRKYDNNQILEILHYWGMVGKMKIIQVIK